MPLSLITQTGRIVYAAAVVGFGAICIYYADFLNSLQPVPAGLPGYAGLAVTVGIVFALAGILILANRQTRAAGLVLAVLLALSIPLLHVPGAFMQPELLRSPFWIRTFESLALAGAALILAGGAQPVREQWVRAGRILFGVSLPVFGVLHFIYAEFTATLIPAWYPWPLFLAYLTGAGHFAAGVAIATGIFARLAALLAGGMYAVWALTLHVPRIIDNPPNGERQEYTSTLVCFAFWGAAWIVAESLRDRRA